MSKSTKKNYYYVLVFTNNGPKFVTKVDNSDRTAEWNTNEKPLEMTKSWAEGLTLGLRCNFFTAFTVCTPIPQESHGYNYDEYEIDFKEKESEDK